MRVLLREPEVEAASRVLLYLDVTPGVLTRANVADASVSPGRCCHVRRVDADSLDAMTEPPQQPLSFVSTFAWSGMEPLRLVVHQADDSWQFLCGTTVEVEYLLTMHAQHVFERFQVDLHSLVGLPRGYLAARDYAGERWSIEPDTEEG
jgi:hypothetical protein